MNCGHCEATGFLNIEQAPDGLYDREGGDGVLKWMETPEGQASDVCVCDCCGDGADWYGEPGSHYHAQDPSGPNGPYAYNGGLCECH